MIFKRIKKLLVFSFLINIPLTSAVELCSITKKQQDENVLQSIARDYSASRNYESVLADIDRLVHNYNGEVEKTEIIKHRYVRELMGLANKEDAHLYSKLWDGLSQDLQPWKLIGNLYGILKPYININANLMEENIRKNYNNFKKDLLNNEKCIYAIKEIASKRLIGGVILKSDGKYLHHIYINQKDESKGYGKKALEKTKEKAKELQKYNRDTKSLTLEAERDSLVGFYSRFGFKQNEQNNHFMKCNL